MSKFLPDVYKNKIFDIDYKKLKKQNIKLLIFDFDNTIVEKGNFKVSEKIIKFFDELKKDFSVFILSNTTNKEKISKFANECKIDYQTMAFKPSKRGFKQVLKRTGFTKDNACVIGDQFLTDIFGAKRMGLKAILVNGIDNDEMTITKLNRVVEKFIIKNLNKKYGFERDKFYD